MTETLSETGAITGDDSGDVRVAAGVAAVRGVEFTATGFGRIDLNRAMPPVTAVASTTMIIIPGRNLFIRCRNCPLSDSGAVYFLVHVRVNYSSELWAQVIPAHIKKQIHTWSQGKTASPRARRHLHIEVAKSSLHLSSLRFGGNYYFFF